MKKLLTVLAFVALSGGALLAQDISGNWQGTLQAGQPLRIVVKISKSDSGALQGLFYSIDQGGQGLPGTVALQGSTVRMTVPAIGGTYEAKLSADGGALAGAWSQGPGSIPLNLTRATSATAWAIPEPPARPTAMAADAKPEFEVATIKPSNPDTPGKAFLVRGRMFSTLNTTLSDLVTFAYGLHARQITGGPAWLETEKFDLTAQPDGQGQPSEKQWKIMLQKLLTDRFKLTFHRDKKELSVYAIVVGRTGPTLTTSGDDPAGLPALIFRGLGSLPARNTSMADFANVMQSTVLDRPVVDQTGLTGRYDFTLTWTPDESQFGGLGARGRPPTDDPAAPPNLFTAIQEQLGLRLEATKAPVEVLVIDSVERATPN